TQPQRLAEPDRRAAAEGDDDVRAARLEDAARLGDDLFGYVAPRAREQLHLERCEQCLHALGVARARPGDEQHLVSTHLAHEFGQRFEPSLGGGSSVVHGLGGERSAGRARRLYAAGSPRICRASAGRATVLPCSLASAATRATSSALLLASRSLSKRTLSS